ncbi:MAG: periplasmic heavy metal sensor [Caulobacteraceae bacterium]
MNARWTFIALVASIALNLFLLGIAVTVIALGVYRKGEGAPQRPNLRSAALTLTPDQRTKFVALLRAEGDGVEAAGRQARSLRASAWGALAAASFDPLVAKADLARARALNQASRGKVEDAVMDFAAGLPSVDRARFGEAMRHRSARQDPSSARERLGEPP